MDHADAPPHVQAANLFHIYCRGWRDGAGYKGIRDDNAKHPTLGEQYMRGWNDGRKAAQDAAAAMSKETGYEPSILRTAEGG